MVNNNTHIKQIIKLYKAKKRSESQGQVRQDTL